VKASHKYPWQSLYFDAVSDVNAVTVHSKIAAARKALDERVAELLVSRKGDAERQAVIDALFSLHFLEMHTRSTEQ
jgi:hypothetical protein